MHLVASSSWIYSTLSIGWLITFSDFAEEYSPLSLNEEEWREEDQEEEEGKQEDKEEEVDKEDDKVVDGEG